MLGALIGDCIGSRYEFANTDSDDLEKIELFQPRSTYTDDSILTVATADALMDGRDFGEVYTEFFLAYPNRGWGGAFQDCIRTNKKLIPYGSYGNGSAMRVSPVAWFFDNEKDVLKYAKETAIVSHDHEDGIKGAQAAALAVFLAKKGANKDTVINRVSDIGYDLSKGVKGIERKKFDVTCQGTIPICMAVFKDCNNFEEAMRATVYLGGDVDTNCAIVGSIFEAFDKDFLEKTRDMQKEMFSRLSKPLVEIVFRFVRKYSYKDYDIGEIEDKTKSIVI